MCVLYFIILLYCHIIIYVLTGATDKVIELLPMFTQFDSWLSKLKPISSSSSSSYLYENSQRTTIENNNHLSLDSLRDKIYLFDGFTTGVVVPNDYFVSNSINDAIQFNNSTAQLPTTTNDANECQKENFGQQHSISFWMKHSPFQFLNNKQQLNANDASIMNDLAKHYKEHILCSSDPHSKFTVYTNNI